MRTFAPAIICTSAFTLLASSAIPALAQTAGSAGSTTSYVYLNQDDASGSVPLINGYAVKANGAIHSLPGSPYSTSTTGWLAAAGSQLFQSNPQSASIDGYTIVSNGAVRFETATDVGADPLGTSSEGPLSLSIDQTGKNLYDLWALNDGYQSLKIENDGALRFVNFVQVNNQSSSALSFTANNKEAFQSGCYEGSPTIEGFTRATNGALTLEWNPEVPPEPSGAQYGYCPYGASVSGNKYVVIAEQQNNEMAPVGPNQLVVYTINENDASLSTTNTAANAANANVGQYVSAYAFDPTGRWLAVGGSSGIAIFSFRNGVLHQTGGYSISVGAQQLDWDNAGHLVVYASTYGQPSDLYVFNVQYGVPTVAPGSPVAAQAGGYLAVKPL
ncbi:MAG TPA: hypothetical protein VIY53_03675 [Acidobacteriaceae bacterium]